MKQFYLHEGGKYWIKWSFWLGRHICTTSAPLPLEKLSSLRCASLSGPPRKDRWRHPPRDRSTIPPCNVIMVNHFYLLYINGDDDYDDPVQHCSWPLSNTGLRNCPMDRPLGSTLRNNSWITAPFQFFNFTARPGQVENVKLIKPKMTPLVIAWYSLLQSSGQCGSSFSRTCATRLLRRFSGKLFVGTMSLWFFWSFMIVTSPVHQAWQR